MKRYLCSNWALNPEDARWVKSMGFSGLRFDIPWAAPKEYIRRAFNTMSDLRLEALAVVGGWCRWAGKPIPIKHFAPPVQAIGIEANRIAAILIKSRLPPNLVAFELGNEPDASEWRNPEQFASFCRLGAQGIWKAIPTASIVMGGVSNVERKGGIRYLERILDAGIDSRIILGIHPYRAANRPLWAPKGWESIQGLFRWLRGRGRPIWVTECGWHTAPQKRHRGPWGLCSKNIQWTDDDVAGFADIEMTLWDRAGADCYCWYQINDGPNPNNPEDNYGLRDHNMNPKPVAQAFQSMWEVS